MEMKTVLLSFVGARDPFAREETEEIGPILSLLGERGDFSTVVLLHTPNEPFKSRALQLAQIVEEKHSAQVLVEEAALEDPTHHETILREVRRAWGKVARKLEIGSDAAVFVFGSSGTPQQQTCWFLLTASGEIPARVLLIREKRFAKKGRSMITEINPRSQEFPRIAPYIQTPEVPTLKREDIRRAREEVGLLGEHPKFLAALKDAAQVARSDASVLILGDSGTGKELMANFIHALSLRNKKEMKVLNCAAIAENLVESELFGHVKGAFTGANRDREGMFMAADKSTLFLDEVGDMSLPVQAKLLRVLEDKKVTPVGGTKPKSVDVRIVAATNRKLDRLMEDGEFRQDLYYRLAIRVELPGLYQRREDLKIIAPAIFENLNSGFKRNVHLGDDALQALFEHTWPGNVRELRNVLSNAIFKADKTIGANEIRDSIEKRVSARADLPEPYEGFDVKKYIEDVRLRLYRRAMELSGNKMSRAARLLGVKTPAVQSFFKNRPE